MQLLPAVTNTHPVKNRSPFLDGGSSQTCSLCDSAIWPGFRSSKPSAYQKRSMNRFEFKYCKSAIEILSYYATHYYICIHTTHLVCHHNIQHCIWWSLHWIHRWQISYHRLPVKSTKQFKIKAVTLRNKTENLLGYIKYFHTNYFEIVDQLF